MRRRNGELILLLAAAILVLVAGWKAAQHHIVLSGRGLQHRLASPTAAVPANLLHCRPEELRSILASQLDEPQLGAAHAAILAWRGALSPGQARRVVLAEVLKVQVRAQNLSAPAISGEQYRALRPLLVVRDGDGALRSWHLYLCVFSGSFLFLHGILRISRCAGSQALVPLAMLLCGASTILLFTFTDPLRDRLLYQPFVHGVLLGCASLAAAVMFLRTRGLEEFRYLIGLGALLLSAALLLLGTGPAGSDTRINLFGLFQPVEFIKLLVVIFLASYLAGRDVELRRLDAVRWRGLSLPRLRDVLPVVLILGAALGLFFLQKDLGPALILYLVFLGMFVITSRRVMIGLSGLALLLSAFWATYRFRLLQTVATRIEMWLSPWDNHRPGGVQLAESLWALASGGFWGSGLGRGEPQYIPAGHTDLILAAAGETLGFPAVAVILVALCLLVSVMVLAAWRAKDAFSAYLGFGLALLVGFQTAVIAAGAVGLIPLTGVPLPFMSYGKSALVAHFILLGLVLNLPSAGTAPAAAQRRIAPAMLIIPATIPIMLAVVGWKTYGIMSAEADALLGRGALSPQADGVRRFSYNRRLLDLASSVSRGSILDRSEVPLATSRPEEFEISSALFRDLGIEPVERFPNRRLYPLGPAAVQLLGHTRGYWTDPRTIERLLDTKLRGYKSPQQVVLVDGRRVVRNDYAALVPAFRDRFVASGGQLEELAKRDKDVRLTLDARLQWIALQALRRNMPVIDGKPRNRGAAVVLDASTGAVLAAVSLPNYDPNTMGEEDLETVFGPESKAAYDRARFEIYPPGSAFKVVIAAAAVDTGWLALPGARRSYFCRHVNEIPWVYGGEHHRRRVTDDEAESAHHRLELPRALVESCNVYFAWLGTQLGADKLFEFARSRFQLELKSVSSAADLEANLPDNAYGQAMVTASPLRMAAVAATVANGGLAVEPWLLHEPDRPPAAGKRILKESTAAALREWMVAVVGRGTGRRAAVPGLVVGGKTGTAQNEIGDRKSHSWFIGFGYPAGRPPEQALAFAFLIENGGYGGRAAAQAAHDFLQNCLAAAPAAAARGAR